jgi:hypothetical protein
MTRRSEVVIFREDHTKRLILRCDDFHGVVLPKDLVGCRIDRDGLCEQPVRLIHGRLAHVEHAPAARRVVEHDVQDLVLEDGDDALERLLAYEVRVDHQNVPRTARHDREGRNATRVDALERVRHVRIEVALAGAAQVHEGVLEMEFY